MKALIHCVAVVLDCEYRKAHATILQGLVYGQALILTAQPVVEQLLY